MASSPDERRALVLQGGGSLGAYEAGAYKAIYPFLTQRDKEKGNAGRPTFDVISGTSIGAINGAILVSYVMENKTWEGSAERLIEFWNYVSVDSIPDRFADHFIAWWDYWTQFFRNIATSEAARRHYSTKEFSFMGVPNVFSPPHGAYDMKFFDPSNAWYRYDNQPLKKSLEKFAKFPIAASYEDNQPRLILTAVDVAEGVPVVFDSYVKEDGTRKTEYGRYIVDKDIDNGGSDEGKKIGFEHTIRYNEGITVDHVIASAAVPVYYDYVQLEAESYDPQTKNFKKEIRYFWDGGLLSNTPLMELILAYRQYWYWVKGVKERLPKLNVVLINLHPSRVNTVPWDYDGVVNRNSDIRFADRSKREETMALLISDCIDLAKKVIKVSKDHGVKQKVIDDLLEELPASHGRRHGMAERPLKYRDFIEGQINIGEVIRIERKHDERAVSNKFFDFSSNTIKQLLEDGYNDVVDYIKARFGTEDLEAAGMQYSKPGIPAGQIHQRQE